MSKKATSLVAVLVAVCGAALAAIIPAASAAKSYNTYTQYCQNGTNTVYKAYSSDCPTTTTKTVVPPKHDGIRVLVAGTLVAGETLAPGVVVVLVKPGYVEIYNHGEVFIIPADAQLTVTPAGSVVWTTSTLKLLTQGFVLPPGVSAKALTYYLPAGASFGGTKSKLKTISSYFTVKTSAIKNLIAGRHPAVALTKVKSSVTAAAKARGNATLTASKYLTGFVVTLNLKGIKYTAAKTKALKKAKTKKLNAHVIFKTKAKKTQTIQFTYAY